MGDDECSGETFACLGEAVMVLLIGVPAALTLAWLGLRTLGTSNPVLAVGLTFLVGSLGSSALDAPLWFWPVAIGAVGCVLIALLGARAGQAPRQVWPRSARHGHLGESPS